MPKKLNLAVVVLVFASLLSLAHISTTRANPKSSKIEDVTVQTSTENNDKKITYIIDENRSRVVFDLLTINPLTKKNVYISGETHRVQGYGWINKKTNESYLSANTDLKEFTTELPFQKSMILNLLDDTQIFINTFLDDTDIPMGIEKNANVPLSIAFNQREKLVPFEVIYTVSNNSIKSEGKGIIDLADFGINANQNEKVNITFSISARKSTD